MSAMPAALAEIPSPIRLTEFEGEFIRTVLEHRGILSNPTDSELDGAIEVLRSYDKQCIANPAPVHCPNPRLDITDMAALCAKAYMMFGTIRPTPAQWHRAHTALFGPLLCETCG